MLSERGKEEYVVEGKPMVKTLNRVGNSMALIIDKPILALLQITIDTELEIRTDGQRILISPVRKFDGVRADPKNFGLLVRISKKEKISTPLPFEKEIQEKAAEQKQEKSDD